MNYETVEIPTTNSTFSTTTSSVQVSASDRDNVGQPEISAKLQDECQSSWDSISGRRSLSQLFGHFLSRACRGHTRFKIIHVFDVMSSLTKQFPVRRSTIWLLHFVPIPYWENKNDLSQLLTWNCLNMQNRAFYPKRNIRVNWLNWMNVW